MTEAEIIAKVRAIMNDLGEEASATLLGQDMVMLAQYITKAIPDAVSLIQAASENRCVNRKSVASPSVTTTDGMTVYVLPNDYVSLVAVKMNGWKKVAVRTYPYDSEQYQWQCNPVTRSGANNPIVIEGVNASGSKVLEMYTNAEQKTITTFVYEAKYASASGLNLDAADPVAQAVCYMTAALVYQYFENPSTCKELQDTALALLK